MLLGKGWLHDLICYNFIANNQVFGHSLFLRNDAEKYFSCRVHPRIKKEPRDDFKDNQNFSWCACALISARYMIIFFKIAQDF